MLGKFTPRVNFINISHAVFTCAQIPKAQKTLTTWLNFDEFKISVRKRIPKHVGEIDPWIRQGPWLKSFKPMLLKFIFL